MIPIENNKSNQNTVLIVEMNWRKELLKKVLERLIKIILNYLQPITFSVKIGYDNKLA